MTEHKASSSVKEWPMTEQEFGELMVFLKETPAAVRQLTAEFQEHDLKWKPSENELSALEQVCHLRDLELEGYAARIRKLLTETEPSLPDFEGGRFVRERDYNSQDFLTALQDFARARKENIRSAETLSSDQLNLSGLLEGVGVITLARLFQLMREHDQSHIDELRVLRERLPGQHQTKSAALNSSAAPQ
jgi:hypothetical protein